MGRVAGDFLSRSKRKSYKKFLTRKNTVPTAEEYENEVTKSNKRENDIVKVNDTNK